MVKWQTRFIWPQLCAAPGGWIKRTPKTAYCEMRGPSMLVFEGLSPPATLEEV
jgi:hypothetical protein